MTPVKLKESLLAQEASRDVNAVCVSRPTSIRFLDMKVGRRVYMKKIVEVQQGGQSRKWSGRIRIIAPALPEDRRRCFSERRQIEVCRMDAWYGGLSMISMSTSWKGTCSGEMLWQGIALPGSVCDTAVEGTRTE